MSIELKLEQECYPCYGTGRVKPENKPEYLRCSTCRGTGLVLTEVGLQIVDLAKRYLSANLDSGNLEQH